MGDDPSTVSLSVTTATPTIDMSKDDSLRQQENAVSVPAETIITTPTTVSTSVVTDTIMPVAATAPVTTTVAASSASLGTTTPAPTSASSSSSSLSLVTVSTATSPIPAKKKRMVKKKKKLPASEGDEGKALRKPQYYVARAVLPDQFEPSNHFYPRVLNANLHPMVLTFMSLGNTRICQRYCHLNPKTNYEILLRMLTTRPKHFVWSGADLFNVTNVHGKRQMIVIETNSCPSGQKSMPGVNEDTADGYHAFMKNTFLPMMSDAQRKSLLPDGVLAVIYDKNPMEAKGYAAALADVAKEPVWVAEFYEDDRDPPVKWENDIMMIRDEKNEWKSVRACFRYVTQRPWSRIPTTSRTLIANPVVACLAGGRNKMFADKAYEFFNRENEKSASNLTIRCPETIRDVSRAEIPIRIETMGGRACIKVPYSNAGQGVYTILNEHDLKKFMDEPQHYDKYIVQSLVGNSSWMSGSAPASQYFHTGCIPNKSGAIYIADLRMMIRGDADGWHPLAVYARRAHLPLCKNLTGNEDSWGMLGTNLSVKNEKGDWDTETQRLLLMDMKDFNRLGIAIDDLIDAYVQTVLATTAIDLMCQRLTMKGYFDYELYKSLNGDEALLKEIMVSWPSSTPSSGALASPVLSSWTSPSLWHTSTPLSSSTPAPSSSSYVMNGAPPTGSPSIYASSLSSTHSSSPIARMHHHHHMSTLTLPASAAAAAISHTPAHAVATSIPISSHVPLLPSHHSRSSSSSSLSMPPSLPSSSSSLLMSPSSTNSISSSTIISSARDVSQQSLSSVTPASSPSPSPSSTSSQSPSPSSPATIAPTATAMVSTSQTVKPSTSSSSLSSLVMANMVNLLFILLVLAAALLLAVS